MLKYNRSGYMPDNTDYVNMMTSYEPYILRLNDAPYELHQKAMKHLREFNNFEDESDPRKDAILSELFGTYNSSVFICSGFKCDYGINIHFHGPALVNYNVVMLDTSPIDIGAGVFIAPGVVLHDVPAGVIAAGNPCKVIRNIL